MSPNKKITTGGGSNVVAEMRALLGPAKAWSTDDPAIYDKMYQRFAESLGVEHPIILPLIWDLVHETCEISALRRVRSALPERAFQAKIEREVGILTVLLGERPPRGNGLFDFFLTKQEESQPESPQVSKQEEAAAAGTKTDASTATADEQAAAAALAQEKAAIRKQIEAVKKKRPTELDLYGAFEERIGLYERITRQITLAMARRDALLRDIEYYSNGLGQQVRQISDTIIDGEVNEEAVSVHEIEMSPANSAVAESTTQSTTELSTMSQRNVVGSNVTRSTNSKLDSRAGSSNQTECTQVSDECSSSMPVPVPLRATGAATTESLGKFIESSEDLTGSADNLAQPAVPSPTAIGPLQEAAEIALPTAAAEPPVIEPAIIESTVADPVVSTMQAPTEERAAEERPRRGSGILVAGFSIESGS
jgi:hypothetical protein